MPEENRKPITDQLRPPTGTNFSTLLEGVPVGYWAAISRDGTEVLASGLDLEEVLRRAPQGVIARMSSGLPLVL